MTFGIHIPKGGLNVTLLAREDGGLRICSDQVPGLILSGKNPEKVLADVWPALNEILQASDKP